MSEEMEIEIEERNRGEAAIRIDKDMLHELRVECTGQSNPLHFGAQHGLVDFVKEILSQKPKLAFELNSQGQSPLHLASARGHVGVVTEISKAVPGACFVRDRDGMIPLHLAAIKGRLDVLGKLVNANIKTAYILTDRGEPILHLCAKYHQFKALEKLVELVQDDAFVNLKDNDDNTILHALSEDGNLKAMMFLVKTGKGVEVNAKNTDGFTPLDLAPVSGSLTGVRMYRSLKRSGFKRGGKNSQSVRRLPIGKQIEGNEAESRFAEALMVVAVLTVTVAFQTRLNPPGGVWQETAMHNATLPNATQPKQVLHNAGRPIMSYVNFTTYTLFAISNDVTLTLSLFVIQLLLSGYLSNSTSKILNLAAGLAACSLFSMSFSYFVWTLSISSGKLLFLGSVLVYASAALYVVLLLKAFCRAYETVFKTFTN